MKKGILLVFLCFAMQISFATFPTSDVDATQNENAAPLSFFTQEGKFDAKKFRAFATNLKGGKLTIKEKLGLKLFGKKIAKNFQKADSNSGGKSQLVALLLCFFLGGLGIHRFYLGYTWQGIVQLLTAGGLGIWWLIDFIRICTGDLKPKNGEYGTTL